jgi:carnitine 3-dehydrogenase
MSPIPGLRCVGLLGGGVIGNGWAARFLLNGVDVQLYDPDPEAPRAVGEVLVNARRALARMLHSPLPGEGTLTFVATPEEAATGADFVQESAPERLDLKQSLLQRASTAAGPSVVFASSTSRLLPSRLQEGMVHPERLVVGHPFDPVYLLPLVEVCGGPLTSAIACERAAHVYAALGMHPLRLRTESDGLATDRLSDALWREARALVDSGVATAEDADDAIRFGAGLHWSVVGPFLGHRLADSERDSPATGRSTRELEAARDERLVAVMQGLRTADIGAGQVLDRFERQLFDRAGAAATAGADLTSPLRLLDTVVPTEWVDYNGHMNDSRFFQVTSQAGDRLLQFIGCDQEYLTHSSYYTVESHVNFGAQAVAGDRIYATVQLLSHDVKRLHMFVTVHGAADDAVLATAEHMLLHVDVAAGRAAPAAPHVLARLDEVAAHHSRLPRPANAGRAVGAPRS